MDRRSDFLSVDAAKRFGANPAVAVPPSMAHASRRLPGVRSIAGGRENISRSAIGALSRPRRQPLLRPQDRRRAASTAVAWRSTRCFEHLEVKFSYNVDRFGEFHHREFYTIAEPTFRQLKRYWWINARAPISAVRRLERMAGMTIHFLRNDAARLLR